MKERLQMFVSSAVVWASIAVGIRYYQSSYHSEVVQIIQESRARYIQTYIYKASLDVQLYHEFSEKHGQEVARIWYDLWEKHGDFPYDIFRQEVYKKYGVILKDFNY